MSACPRCAHVAPAGARFCPSCGGRLAGPEPARYASPEAYTPAHLAQRILDSRAALEGERKQVTVLFADIHGVVDVLGDRDPEELGPTFDRMRELMMEAVHRYEGTVNQVVGDGIMALFGAPLANEDHAVRACYAALRMQAEVTAYGEQVQRSLGRPLSIRVGVNSGEVVVRSIGSDLSFTYTAVGQTVHMAARMEQMAKPGSILATEDTAALVRGRVARCRCAGCRRRCRCTRSAARCRSGRGSTPPRRCVPARRWSAARPTWRGSIGRSTRCSRAAGRSSSWWARWAWASRASASSWPDAVGSAAASSSRRRPSPTAAPPAIARGSSCIAAISRSRAATTSPRCATR
jgi:class 3 adenylate cyclase